MDRKNKLLRDSFQDLKVIHVITRIFTYVFKILGKNYIVP